MGIKERQGRDRETVRRAILDAARDLFVSEGYGNVSIRKVAERIEYSPAALYSYFPSKDDIFFALASEGFDLLGASPAGPGTLDDQSTPLKRLRRTVWRLYEFSVEHPEYFSLMFLDRSVPRISRADECFPSARRLKLEIEARIRACVDAGDLPPSTRTPVTFRLLTVGLLGMAAMRLSHRVPAGEHPDALARDILDVTIAGLQTGIPLRSNAVGCPLEEPGDARASSMSSLSS
ncbi:MAG: TetR/AcrR family transcriptional regulator [Acidimicrobiia bacterium]|nr:TetR/AcrR family transcriptional regulator [Acidimicrobiia bacterium]